jgi:chemotaxis protein CheX
MSFDGSSPLGPFIDNCTPDTRPGKQAVGPVWTGLSARMPTEVRSSSEQAAFSGSGSAFFMGRTTCAQEAATMNVKYINPFLASSIHVIEAMMQVKPSVGQVALRAVENRGDSLLLKIGILGQFQGDVVFSFPQRVALRIVSVMMGGYPVSELDEMCCSAIAELGNMISGNASTMLYNEGIQVDITPPDIVSDHSRYVQKKAITIPLDLSDIGNFNIYMFASGL